MIKAASMKSAYRRGGSRRIQADGHHWWSFLQTFPIDTTPVGLWQALRRTQGEMDPDLLYTGNRVPCCKTLNRILMVREEKDTRGERSSGRVGDGENSPGEANWRTLQREVSPQLQISLGSTEDKCWAVVAKGKSRKVTAIEAYETGSSWIQATNHFPGRRVVMGRYTSIVSCQGVPTSQHSPVPPVAFLILLWDTTTPSL